MSLLIKGGRVIDPSCGLDEIMDILVADGKIRQLGKDLEAGGEVVEAGGLIVAPGFIDMHVHLREPGREDKETIRSGTRAAVAGGFTSICPMPNTDPVNDNQAVTEYILSIARRTAVCNVYPIGAVSVGQKGERLTNIGELKQSGAAALSDDGRPIMNAELMRRALEYASMFDLPVISHCEDLNLAGDGLMHEGPVSTRLGMPPVPAAAEEVMVARDLILAELTGGRLHFAHISTAKSVELIREAKKKLGVMVTAEAAPHHFSLTDEAVVDFDTNTKVNPPLRSRKDVEAVKRGLSDGTIDVIATDHAPHTLAEKELEFSCAPFGIVGLETALSLTVTGLVEPGFLSWPEVLTKLTKNPARIMGLDRGTLQPGAVADITIIDPGRKIKVDSSKFYSKAGNTPFDGWELSGVVRYTFLAGKPVFKDGQVLRTC